MIGHSIATPMAISSLDILTTNRRNAPIPEIALNIANGTWRTSRCSKNASLNPTKHVLIGTANTRISNANGVIALSTRQSMTSATNVQNALAISLIPAYSRACHRIRPATGTGVALSLRVGMAGSPPVTMHSPFGTRHSIVTHTITARTWRIDVPCLRVSYTRHRLIGQSSPTHAVVEAGDRPHASLSVVWSAWQFDRFRWRSIWRVILMPRKPRPRQMPYSPIVLMRVAKALCAFRGRVARADSK